MEKSKKLELLKRQLGLRHKLKVHDSTKAPETHEEMAVNLVSKWEFEDEIQAIEELLSQARQESVREKRELIIEELRRGGKLTKSWAEKRVYHDGVQHIPGNGAAAVVEDEEEDGPAPSPSASAKSAPTPKGRGAPSKSGSSSRKS